MGFFMELKGLTVNFLGDSITEGYGTTDSDKQFHQIIKEQYGLKCAYNYGVGGTRIARCHKPSQVTIWDYTFELRAEIMDKNADAVIVFGGTNDYGHGDAPFGTIESHDIYTFCGAVNSLVDKLKNDFPKSKIVFMTPIHRLGETAPASVSPDGKTLADYANVIVEICKKKDVAVIDLFKINPLDPADATLVPDGLHPNDDGHKVMAKVIAEELIKL